MDHRVKPGDDELQCASLTLPWRGRVGSHGAKRNAKRGGVISQLGHCSRGGTVTPPRRALRVDPRASFARLGPLQGRVRSRYAPTAFLRQARCTAQLQPGGCEAKSLELTSLA